MLDSDTTPEEREELKPRVTADPPADAAGDADSDEDVDEEHLSAAARWVGSGQTIVWAKRIVMGLALAFLVASIGYLVGVKTTVPPSSAVDVGFYQDMTEHHDQAVSMALDEIANGSDPVVKGFAKEVLLFQRWENGLMAGSLEQRGAPDVESSPDRTTMAWMGMPTPLKNMPGMASPEQLKKLGEAKGWRPTRSSSSS